MYSKKKLTESEKTKLMRFLSQYEYICGSSFQELPDGDDPVIAVIRKVFVRENIS